MVGVVNAKVFSWLDFVSGLMRDLIDVSGWNQPHWSWTDLKSNPRHLETENLVSMSARRHQSDPFREPSHQRDIWGRSPVLHGFSLSVVFSLTLHRV